MVLYAHVASNYPKRYNLTRGRMKCPICRYQCTMTAGTLFEKSWAPLTNRFVAAWYITNEKHGVSTSGLQMPHGLGSYQTAWTMLHRYRREMVKPSRGKLSGLIEADETLFARSEKGSKMPDRKPKIRAKKRGRSLDDLVTELTARDRGKYTY